MSDLDSAAVLVTHSQHENEPGWCAVKSCVGPWPCLPHRLAAALAAAEQQMQQVEALADAWDSRGDHLLVFALTAPDDVQDELLDQGHDWKLRAQNIRTALAGAI